MIAQLTKELVTDIDDAQGIFGIGWWFPHPGTSRRIVISDYLIRATESIETNLVEARLHLFEAMSAFDEEDAFMSRAVDYDEQGRAQLSIPPRTRGSDDLNRFLRDLHIAGFFRAVGSALDCLAATVVGVAAIPQRIQFADLGNVRRFLQRPMVPGSPEDLLWSPIRDALELLANANHPGWLAWTLDYRNTLVHRARPVTLHSLKPAPTLERPDRAVPHIRTTQVMLLARDPRRSDIEVLQGSQVPVLTEDARTTIECIFDQTRHLCETLGGLLADTWRTRRTTPAILIQPRDQWPDFPSAAPSPFDGCSPGDELYNPGLFGTGPDVTKRMRAASLLNSGLAAWAAFD